METENEILESSWYLFIQCPPSAPYSSCIISFNPHNNLRGGIVLNPHFFSDEEIQTQRGYTFCSSLRSQSVTEAELESRSKLSPCFSNYLMLKAFSSGTGILPVCSPSALRRPAPPSERLWSHTSGYIAVFPGSFSTQLEVIPHGCLSQPLFEGTRTSL